MHGGVREPLSDENLVSKFRTSEQKHQNKRNANSHDARKE